MLANLLMLTPLLLTLVLALVLRRTLVALGVGIVSGALILSSFNPLESIHYLSSTAWQQFYANGQWQAWHLNVLAAMVLLGVMTQLLARAAQLNLLLTGCIIAFKVAAKHALV